MVSERAFAAETADVQQTEVAPEHIGEEGEVAEVQASAEPAAATAEDDENVDLEAVLGGGIRKAPAAAAVDEPESLAAETGA
jgi:small subunit ribosomal protein S2